MKGVNRDDLCILCNDWCGERGEDEENRTEDKGKGRRSGRKRRKRQQEVDPEPETVTKKGNGEKCGLLQSQLRVMYLLEKVFKKNLRDPEVLRLLSSLGNPDSWFGICKACQVVVDDGIQVWRELKRLEERHKRILGLLVERELLSRPLEVVTDLEGNSRLDRIRRSFRQRLRGTEKPQSMAFVNLFTKKLTSG